MNELYTLQFDYNVIFGQSYRLVPMPSTIVPQSFIAARDRLISQTNQKLQRANNDKNR